MDETDETDAGEAPKLTCHKRRNVLTRMEVVSGPLSLLQRSANERQRIRVVTRNARHVRGICTGFLVAFDKHCNLAMVDVDEVYKNPREKPTIPKKKKRRKRNVILKAVTQMKGRKTAVDVSAQVQSSPVRMKQELSAQVDGTLDSSSEDDSLDFTLTLSDSGSAASGTESDELMKKMACIKQELAELESTSAKSPRDNSKAHSSSRASASKNYHKVHRSREREAKSSRDDQSVNDLRFKLLRNKGHSDERSESRSREAHSHHRRSQSPHSGGGSSLRRRDKHRDAYHRQETDHKHSHHIHSTSHESRSRHHDALRSSRHSPLRSSHRTGRSSPVSESRHSVRDHRPPREKFHHLSSSSSSRHERKERSSRSSDNKKSEESKWRHREESPSNSDHVSSKDKSSYHDKGNDTKLSAGGKSCTVRLERMTLVDEKLKLQADREPSSCSNNESDSPSSDGRQGSRTNGAIDSNPTQGYQLVLERHVRQLFIRGDNVVLISILE